MTYTNSGLRYQTLFVLSSSGHSLLNNSVPFAVLSNVTLEAILLYVDPVDHSVLLGSHQSKNEI